MASFLETSPIQFTPFIPDVDPQAYQAVNNAQIASDQALTRVGMAKQRQYDVNLRQIFATYDQVNGLPVAREIDKQYLNQKMAEVSSEFSKMSGSDFSNAGMMQRAKLLGIKAGKDPIIQRSVSSAANMRQLEDSYKTLKEKHPERYAPDNEWWDKRDISRYINSKDLNDQYTGPTSPTPYHDAAKRLDEGVKSLKAQAETTISNDGEVMYRIDGREWISEKQVREQAELMLTPEYQNQLRISAAYTMQGYDPANIAQMYNGTLEQNLQENKNYLGQLNALIAAEQDPAQSRILRSQIERAESNIKQLEAGYVDADAVMNNRNEYEYVIYKNNILQSLVDANAVTTKTSATYHNIPDPDGVSGNRKRTGKIDPLTGLPTTPMISNVTLDNEAVHVDNSYSKSMKDIQNLYSEAGTHFSNFIEGLYKTNPEMFDTTPGSDGTTVHRIKDDLDQTQQELLGEVFTYVKENVDGFDKLLQLSPVSNYYGKLMAAWKAKAQGRAAEIEDLPEGTKKLVEDVQLTLGLANAKEQHYGTIEKTAARKAYATIDNIIETSYPKTKDGKTTVDPSTYNFMVRKEFERNLGELLDKDFAMNNNRGAISEEWVNALELKSKAKQLLATRTTKVNGQDSDPIAVNSEDIVDLEIVEKFNAEKGTNDHYLSGVIKGRGDSEKNPDKTFEVLADDQLISKFNLGTGPHDKINQIVQISGRTNVLHTTSSNEVIIPFEIVKNNAAPGDFSVTVNIPIYSSDGSKIVSRKPLQIPNAAGEMTSQVFPRASDAYEAMNNTARQMRMAGYTDIYTFLEAMKQQRKQKVTSNTTVIR